MPPTTVGRKSSPGRATLKKVDAPKKADAPENVKAVRLTLGDHGTFTLTPDWTARVAAKVRREMGCTPESIIEELAGVSKDKADRASIDTAVRLFVFAAWQCGTDLSYDDLLDGTLMSTSFTIDTDPAEDDSPEA